MASTALGSLKVVGRIKSFRSVTLIRKAQYSTVEVEDDETRKPVTGFAASYIKQSKITDDPKEESFAALLRKSMFVDLGDPEGKKVIGTIYHVVGDDLYIDFGWKFPTVCSKPRKNQELYIKGAKVKLYVKDLELSSRFLGGTTDITLCEADCVLIGVVKTLNT